MFRMAVFSPRRKAVAGWSKAIMVTLAPMFPAFLAAGDKHVTPPGQGSKEYKFAVVERGVVS